MKKVYLFLTIFFALCLTACLNAQVQTDSTITHTQLQALNSGAESGLTIIVGIIAKKYPVAAPFAGIFVTLIMALIRRIEKKSLKKKVATELKDIDRLHPLNEQNAPNTSRDHRGAIGRLIDRLEGKKN